MKRRILVISLLFTSFAYAFSLGNSLVDAIYNMDYELVNSLLESGANPDGNISNSDAISPLGVACNRGNVQIVKLLLTYGANPNHRPKNNSSPFFYTVVGTQKPEIMQLLIDYGLEINTTEPGQDHYAFIVISLGHSKTLKILVDAGLNTNIKDKDGFTLSEWAKKVGRKDCYDIINKQAVTKETDDEITLINYDKLFDNLTHSINDNSKNTIWLNESIYIPKGTLKVIQQVPWYSRKRYLVCFDTYNYSGPFIIEVEQSERLNVTYNSFINQDLRLCLIGYANYTDNNVEIETYRLGIDTREIKNNLLEKPPITEAQSKIEFIETEVSLENKKEQIERDHINFSFLGGISLQGKPVLDLNLKIYCFSNLFIVLQGGGTPANPTSLKISSMSLLPEGTVGIGGSVKPIKSYKLNIFGYASVGFAGATLKGGYVRDGEYSSFSLYPMFRCCVGLDIPISRYFAISIQDCFDYLINLGFTDSVSAGLTIKL